ncbi:hypothetical protein [Nannocystis pusilla]
MVAELYQCRIRATVIPYALPLVRVAAGIINSHAEVEVTLVAIHAPT